MQTPSYIAILGRQPELGLIELESILGGSRVSRWGDNALIESAVDLKNLGGSTKLGRIIDRFPVTRLDRVRLNMSLLPRPNNKLTFGVSVYGLRLRSRELEVYGLSLKRELKASGSVRLVTPKDSSSELSAAQLKFNNLPQAGFELILASNGHEFIVALTEQYQDIDAYSARDYDRPARSAKVGMLPPKLAQILVNTTQSDSVYDPFCGTGVILQEALLMGRQTAGSDLDQEMTEATKTNLVWLAGQVDRKLPVWKVSLADARDIQLPSPGLAIVSEGYLGPNLTQSPKPHDLPGLIDPLLELYRAALANLAKQLESGGEVSICAPAWRISGQWHPLPILDDVASLGYTIKVFQTVKTCPVVYGRADQQVGRALILLTKV